MMKRNEAWDDLLNQAEQIPDELETRLNRTIARAERREKRRRWLKPLIGVTGTAAAFVLLVNSSVTFALAASRVPIVRLIPASRQRLRMIMYSWWAIPTRRTASPLQLST